MSKYVRFTCECTRPEITPFAGFAELNAHRRKLCELQLIGMDSNAIGFGNLSTREEATCNFFITGSATGGKSELTSADCARVVAYDFERNWLRYEGSAIPSSESLTHAAVYESDTKAGAVIHCHDLKLWTVLLDQIPTSSNSVNSGTREMAHEVMRLFRVTDLHRRRILVMAGHEGGIITFGRNFEDAFTVLMDARMESSTCVDSAFHQRTPARDER
jgi:L-ribulose-5-phosphate 4-epimerase